jgi:hypothetical protein
MEILRSLIQACTGAKTSGAALCSGRASCNEGGMPIEPPPLDPTPHPDPPPVGDPSPDPHPGPGTPPTQPPPSTPMPQA